MYSAHLVVIYTKIMLKHLEFFLFFFSGKYQQNNKLLKCFVYSMLTSVLKHLFIFCLSGILSYVFFFRYSGEKKIGYEISFESLVFNLNYLPILKKK